MCKICINHSGAMERRLLVQGRLKVCTGRHVSPKGEKRGRLREGLREGVNEGEMFAGCLKEDEIDAMLTIKGRPLRN